MMKFISKKENSPLKMENEFLWVLKVLESSITLSQVTSAQKLLKNFLDKWDPILDLTEKSKKSLIFTQEKTQILSKILKKV